MSDQDFNALRGDRAATSAEKTGLDPSSWPAHTLAKLQTILDSSLSRAGDAVRETFDRPRRRMTAIEFVEFWNGCKTKAMSTVGPNGNPHIAPVHATFIDGRLRTTIYVNAVRRHDLHLNPSVAMTTWAPGGATAVVYGRAREIPDSERETRPGASGQARRTVTLEIEVSRIYTMKTRPEAA
jgi:hypothetical protein